MVLGAVYLISRAASAPRVFRFYLAFLLLSVLSWGLTLFAYYLFQSWAPYSGEVGVQYIALAIGVYGCNIAAGAFVFASFAGIHDAMESTRFLWTGRVLFLGSVASIIPFVGGAFGIVGAALQLTSFGSLGGATKSSSPAPGATNQRVVT